MAAEQELSAQDLAPLNALDSVPNASVAYTLMLVRSLISAADPVLQYKGAKRALTRLRAAAEELRSIYGATPPPKPESITRAADNTMDKAVKALHDRLVAYEGLVKENADTVDAANIVATIFPRGLEILNLRYREEWAEIDTLLQRVESEKLQKRIGELAGAVFLSNVAASHKAYGEALNITKAKDEEVEMAKVMEPFHRTRQALGTYVGVVVSAAKNQEISIADALRALAPVSTAKAENKPARGKKEEAADPERVDEPGKPLPPIED